jgi:hypothetical protein
MAVNQPPEWEKLRQDLTYDPLSRTQKVADKWITILSALVGLTTIFGLIQGRDALSKLSTLSQIVLVCLFVLALVTSVLAIWLAALASEGTPSDQLLDRKHFSDWYGNATRQAITRLMQSRLLALVSVALVSLALVFSWFAPEASATATSILVVEKSGEVVCGTLIKGSSGIELQTSSGQIDLNNKVVSLSIVSSCP